ncbi:MAG: hypothetical protein EPO13_11730 [Actinomycetota bacterium]|nr:MAG: hypothetical protein EPO13_11730 [Actinomycetota bacterium]
MLLVDLDGTLWTWLQGVGPWAPLALLGATITAGLIVQAFRVRLSWVTRAVLWGVGALSVIVAAVLVLRPDNDVPGVSDVSSAAVALQVGSSFTLDPRNAAAQVAGRALLFLPLACLLVVLWRGHPVRAVLVLAALGTALEALRALASGSRALDLDNVLAGYLGAVLGAALGMLILRWSHRLAAAGPAARPVNPGEAAARRERLLERRRQAAVKRQTRRR